MSPIGLTRTSRGVRAYVACWVKADVAEGQEHQAASLVRRRTGSGLHLRDRDGQKLAYVYFEDEPGRRSAAKLLTGEKAPTETALLLSAAQTGQAAPIGTHQPNAF